jgi:carboxyvinyl-carboxyphosphonate phosphorylmutase
MQWQARREQFRAILSGNGCIRPASVFDPLSARIAEQLGFEMGLMAGSTASLTVLGAPDLVLLTLSEFVQQAQRVCRAMTLPLLVDADHGYGNALNVARTIEELATVGVAAATIEDTVLPVPFGANGKSALISVDEGVGKMRAALAARPDPAFAVIGRTSAPVISNIDDTVMRLRAYERAGVDALFIVGLKSLAELSAVADATTLSLILGNIGGDLVGADIAQDQRRPDPLSGADMPAGPLADHGGRASRLRNDEGAARRHQSRRHQERRLERPDEYTHARGAIRRSHAGLPVGAIRIATR